MVQGSAEAARGALSPKLIDRIASALGLGRFSTEGLLRLSERVPVAAWGYDEEEKSEVIVLNPVVVESLSVEEVVTLVVHEALHRAAYGWSYHFDDQQLGNIVLDAVVNKVLYKARPRVMLSLWKSIDAIYPPGPLGSNPGCITRFDLTDKGIPEKYRRIWSAVWEDPGVPSPYRLYVLLKMVEKGSGGGKREQGDSRESGAQDDADGQTGAEPDRSDDTGESRDRIRIRSLPDGADPFKSKDDRMKAAGEKALSQASLEVKSNCVDDRLSDAISHVFSVQKLTPRARRERSIEELLSAMRRVEVIKSTLSTLVGTIRDESMVSVIPDDLSLTGYMMLAAGISQVSGLYWTQEPFDHRPDICFYVDTSPSMDPWKRFTVDVVSGMKDELPTEMFVFSGSVKECLTEDFAAGNYHSGSSTSFNAVIKHFLTCPQEVGLILTDGESSVADHLKEEFRRSGKRLFTVLVGSEGDTSYDGLCLKEISELCVSIPKDQIISRGRGQVLPSEA